MTKHEFSTAISIILDILFDKKFYDMIKIISKHESFLNYWFARFIDKYSFSDNFEYTAKLEITKLINMNIITPKEMYKTMQLKLYFAWPITPYVLSFIKNTYNV
jgi:hypothetical protein